jgi:predicted transcriptional regulator
MSVLGILKMSGALPLNELSLRSGASSEQLTKELQALKDIGLVKFDHELPLADAFPSTDMQVQLTLKGLRTQLT